MDLPKITIITPTWNAGQSILSTLGSVAAQSYRNIEHIIIDGASVDETLPLIRKFQETHRNIRLFSEPDNGIYHAMNKGLDLCEGDWIYYLGAGDELFDDEVIMELHRQGLFDTEQVVYGNVLINGDTPWARNGSIYDGPFDLEKLFIRNICHQGIFYPKRVVREVGYYNEKYVVTADWDYNLRCFSKYRFTFADLTIARFKAGGKSTTVDDHSLFDDFPFNVIKYFNLDPDDFRLYTIESPFFYPMTRYREIELRKTIEAQQKEIARLQAIVEDKHENNH